MKVQSALKNSGETVLKSILLNGLRAIRVLPLLQMVIHLPSVGHASEAVIIKAKGRQAIVQFPAEFVPKTGARIEVGPATEGLSNAAIDAESGGRRPHLIALSMNISSLSLATTSGSSTTTTGSTNLGLSGQYGWNFETIEVGPLVSLAYKSSSGSSATTISGGGFFDYDFLPNVPTANLVVGLGTQLYVGHNSVSSGASSSSFGVLGGGQLKWFCLSHQTALRVDALADYERASGTITTTQTGFLLKGGLQYYF